MHSRLVVCAPAHKDENSLIHRLSEFEQPFNLKTVSLLYICAYMCVSALTNTIDLA